MEEKRVIKKWIPSYAVISLTAMIVLNMIAYFGTRLFTSGVRHYYLGTGLDNMIPFCPVFVLAYIGAYVQWVAGYLLIGMESREFCYHYVSAEMIAKFICLICFLMLPSTLIRPEVDGGGILQRLVRFIYRLDPPDNLFPSIHCLESWVCFRAVNQMKKVPPWFKWANAIMTVFVCLSTVFIKQHVITDVVAGILVVELGICCSNLVFRNWRSV